MAGPDVDSRGPHEEVVFTAYAEAGLWPGLGTTTAGRLAAAGVRRPDDVTPQRLAGIEGVGPARAERLAAAFAAGHPAYAVVELLVPAGLPARLAGRAVSLLGDGGAGRLLQDPWLLLELPEVRVRDADRLAVATLPGVRRGDPRRGRAVTAWLLARAARDGHTLMLADTLLAALAGEDVEEPRRALDDAIDDGRVVAVEPGLGGPGLAAPGADDAGPDEPGSGAPELVALLRYAQAEEAIAEGLGRLGMTARPWSEGRDATAGESDSDAGTAVEHPALAGLDPAQRRAVDAVRVHGVSVLTGGPGTGKSRTVAAVVALAAAYDRQVALAAPTGRAAKRLEELTGAPASTLHRLLGAQGTTGTFARGEDWPLDADVVVVDEASMLDAELAAALLAACEDGTHLLLVGDPAQLPSIGAGRVLGDVVDAGVLPVTELTTLHRQAEGGAIARLATAVREGTLPPAAADDDREVVIVPARDSAGAAHRTVQLVTDSIPRALGIPVEEVQVVTPVHRGAAGTVALNAALKARLNPGAGTLGGFDVGDRVVATANRLDPEGGGFANGEVGVVTAIRDGTLTVAFPAGPTPVTGRAVSDLRHGWAITVHRAQGSEWPAVVAVLPGESGGLLSRPLVYTGFTRARRHLSVVHAAGPALARAVRDVGARPRRTRLAALLRAHAG